MAASYIDRPGDVDAPTVQQIYRALAASFPAA
jgi:hypothetical protein